MQSENLRMLQGQQQPNFLANNNTMNAAPLKQNNMNMNMNMNNVGNNNNINNQQQQQQQ